MKHLVDLDDDLLHEAMNILGTATIKGTVDEALRIATNQKTAERRAAWQRLGEIFAEMPDFDRSEAW